MSLYTCITCRVAFADGDLQRTHYKTDWHRYNLKRKVAELPAVTADIFQQKVLAQKAKVEDQDKPQEETCVVCSKHFSNHNQYENHIKSKKHKENVAKQEGKQNTQVEKNNELNEKNNENLSDKRLLKDQVNMEIKSKLQNPGSHGGSGDRNSGNMAASNRMDISDEEDSDAESCDSWDENAVGIEECLFCSHISSSLENNTQHMTVKHGFFIPDVEYIVDLEGLITYLGEKVGVGHLCLWCNEKGKSFHSTQAVQKHMIDKGHCKMLHEGDVVFEYADFYDYRPSYPDYQAEGATGGEGEAMDVGDEEDEVKTEDLASDGYELVLPSGSTVGHRSLQKYYRQNLPNRKEVTTKSVLPKVLAQYKALGWTGATGEVAKKRVKDLGFIQRLKSHHFTKIGIKANSLQRHFKNPNDPKKN